MPEQNEWISIVDACPKNLNETERGLWRQLILLRLSNNRMVAKAMRLTCFGFVCPKEGMCSFGASCSCKFKIKHSTGSGIIEDNVVMQDSFWNIAHSVSAQDWPDDLSANSIVADWVTGDFAAIHFTPMLQEDHFCDMNGKTYLPPDEGYNQWVHWAFDVHIPRSLAGRINDALAKDQKPNKSVRKTRYDWAGALTHLVAIAEIEGLVSDPGEYGAQALVEKAIADWFAKTSGDIPSEAAIRPYASKVVAAIKVQGEKG